MSTSASSTARSSRKRSTLRTVALESLLPPDRPGDSPNTTMRSTSAASSNSASTRRPMPPADPVRATEVTGAPPARGGSHGSSAYHARVSDPGPMGDDPFQGIPFLGDLAKLLGSQANGAWDGARQLALSIATDGQPEANVDPLDRIALEQLARVAELQVSAASGLPVARSGLLTVVAVTPGVWAARSLDAYRPLFEKLS